MPSDREPTTYSQVFSLTEVISAPLIATVRGDFYAAKSFVRYLREYGFNPPPKDSPDEDFGTLRMVTFEYRTPSGWSQIQVPLISLVPLPLLQVSDAHFNYNIMILGSVTKPVSSRDPKAWAAERDGEFPAAPDEIKTSFAPLSAQKGEAPESTPNLVANMDISINMRQADLPAGIASLLQLVQGAIEGQSRTRLSFDKAGDDLRPEKQTAEYTVTVLERNMAPARGKKVSLRVAPAVELPFLAPLKLTRGTLIDQPEPLAVDAAADDSGRVAIEVACRSFPPERIEARVHAAAEIDMGSGQITTERATSQLRIFPNKTGGGTTT